MKWILLMVGLILMIWSASAVIVNPGESIQDAIDNLPAEGGVIELASGTHDVNDTTYPPNLFGSYYYSILVNKSNVTIQGTHNSFVKHYNNTVNCFGIIDPNPKYDNITFDNFSTISDYGTQLNNFFILGIGTTNFTVQNMNDSSYAGWFAGASGTLTRKSEYILFYNNYMVNVGLYGSETDNYNASYNTILGSSKNYALHTDDHNINMTIIGNNISTAGANSGLLIDGGQNVIMKDNIVEGSQWSIYVTQAVYNATIENNALCNSVDEGIVLLPQAAMQYVVIKNNLIYGGGGGIWSGNLASPSGIGDVNITNNVIYNHSGDGIKVSYNDTKVTITNNIISNNTGYGINNVSGSASITNTYNNIWNNTLGNYSGVSDGTGEIYINPLFANVSVDDFHLQSVYGRWNGSVWVYDSVTSPCIDAGDPSFDYSLEPDYPEGLINLGAFGNTTEASYGSSDNIIKNTSIILMWDDTNPATAQVEYGLDTGYGSTTKEHGISYWHRVEIIGLSAGTTYHYRLISKDYQGTEIIGSDSTFTTRTTTDYENLIKAARGDSALPKTYYVKNGGNNSKDGLSITNAWETLTYADGEVDVGDTICVVDGIYTGLVTFATSGIKESPISFIAYNGTPAINGGVDIDSNYSIIDGFQVYNGPSHGIDVQDVTGIEILNCEVNTSNTDCIYFRDVTYSIIEDTTVHNSSWNGFGLKPSTFFPAPLNHVKLINCTAINNPNHNAFDVQGDYMTYEDCYSNNSSLAPMRVLGTYIVINSFEGENGNNGINFASTFNESLIYNSTLPDMGVYADSAFKIENVVFYNVSTSWSATSMAINFSGGITIEKCISLNPTESYGYTYGGEAGTGTVIVRDDQNRVYKVKSIGASITIEYTNGTVFSENGASSPRIYPTKSNYSFDTSTKVQFTKYNITLRPSSNHLKNITVNQESVPGSDITNITINSSVAENPTWINVTMQNISNEYNISRNGIHYDNVYSDSNGIVRYYYDVAGNEWSEHDFEFTWASTDSGWSYNSSHTYTGVKYRYFTNGTRSIIGRSPLETDTDMGDNNTFSWLEVT